MAAGTFAARYEKIAYTTTPSDLTGTMSLHRRRRRSLEDDVVAHDPERDHAVAVLGRAWTRSDTTTTALPSLTRTAHRSSATEPRPYLTDPVNKPSGSPRRSSLDQLTQRDGNAVIAFLRDHAPCREARRSLGLSRLRNITASPCSPPPLRRRTQALRPCRQPDSRARRRRGSTPSPTSSETRATSGCSVRNRERGRWASLASGEPTQAPESGSDAGSDPIVESFTDGGCTFTTPSRSSDPRALRTSTTPKIAGRCSVDSYASLAGATFTGDITVTLSTYGGSATRSTGSSRPLHLYSGRRPARSAGTSSSTPTESVSDAGRTLLPSRYNDAGTVNTLCHGWELGHRSHQLCHDQHRWGPLTSTHARLASNVNAYLPCSSIWIILT